MKVKPHSVEEVSIKRFYVPYTVSDDCPKCGKERSTDLDREYLQYPSLKKPNYVSMWCESCRHGWTAWVRLTLDLQPCEPPEDADKDDDWGDEDEDAEAS